MADFDAEDMIDSGNSDFDSEDIIASETPEISKTKSALKGAEQGLLLGHADESKGMIEAGMDAGQALLNKITGGWVSPSPSQVGADLASQGIEGDIGPTSSTEMYREARDAARQDYKAAEEANPWSYMGGNLAGGLLLGGGINTAAKGGGLVAKAGQAGQKIMNPMPVPKGTPLLNKIGYGAINALPTAAIAGGGMSEADLTKGEVKDFAKDVDDSMKVGAVIGGALPVAGAGLKKGWEAVKGAGHLVPDFLKVPFQSGMKGKDLANPDYYDETANKINSLVDEAQAPITARQQAQDVADQELADWFQNTSNKVKTNLDSGVMQIEDDATKAFNLEKLKQLDENKALKQKLASDLKMTKGQLDAEIKTRMQQAGGQIKEIKNAAKQKLNTEFSKKISDTESQLSALKDDLDRQLTLEKQAQVSKNKSVVDSLNQETVNIAKSTQNKIGELKDNLGKQFDAIEAAAAKTDVKPDVNDAIAGFSDTLQTTSGLPDNDVANILKRFQPSIGKRDYNSFKNVKNELRKYFEHNNPQVRRAAKTAYGNLNNAYSNALREAGENDLASKIAETNKRWGAAMQLEDSFLSGTNNNRITGEMYAQPETIRTIKSFAEDSPEAIAKMQEASGMLTALDPDSAPAMMQQFKELAGRNQAAQNFKPNVQSVDEALAQNPEAKKLQDLINQFKAQSKDTSKALEGNQDLARLTQTLDELKLARSKGQAPNIPEVDNLLKQGQAIQKQIDEARLVRPNVPSREEMLANNSQYLNKKSQLDSLKQVRGVPQSPEEIQNFKALLQDTVGDEAVKEFDHMINVARNSTDPAVREFGKNPERTREMLTNLIQKHGRKTGDINSDNKLKTLLDVVKSDQGDAAAASMSQRMGEAAQDAYTLSKRENKFSLGANQAGLGVKKLADPVKSANDFLRKGVDRLSKGNKEQMEALSQRLETMSPQGKEYAKVLRQLDGKSTTSKNAIIFGLMQQPQFRNLFHKANGDESSDFEASDVEY